ncbi:MAG: hypothetical protein IJC46_02645 [Clostridia bacterium]|nr:hypothetical protein [Clostridia bacterium]
MAKKISIKKLLLSTLAVVTVAVVSITGTIAYLQDSDSDVNVMTLGNVSIRQNEEQRVDPSKNGVLTEADIEDFEQAKPIYPYVDVNLNGAMRDDYEEITFPNGKTHKLFIGDNAIDKLVSVTNTGKTDAYVRTVIALEAPTDKIDLSFNSTDWTMDKTASSHSIEVDGVKYDLFVCVYKNVLKPGETTPYSLMQILLDRTATNEDAAAYGDTYDVLVLSQAIQTAGFEDAATALNTGFGVVDSVSAAEWMGGAIEAYQNSFPDVWDGTSDTTWYNDADTEFTLTSAEQLAGLAELVNTSTNFEGKTVKLNRDVDMSGHNFTPIGGFDKENAYFAGTFDGDDHTIFGLTENGWDLGYEYGETSGMGLFGVVYNATIKDVKIDNAEISMEAVVMGVVAGYANGDCTFEGIDITNTQIANYNWDTGGIVGQVYGSGCTFTFKDIVVDETTTISGHWGTWDVSAGGVIGRTANGVNVVMEDITVAAKLDVYNDVCAAYQWYAYRYSGMLVGYTKTTAVTDGRTVATAPHVTCKNVTVIYDDWANYTYCQPSNVAPQYVRVQGGYSTDPYYSGRHWTAGVDAAGNKMVDDNHVHAAGQAHNELIVFDQLFGGGQGVYGTATHDGVTVIYNNK